MAKKSVAAGDALEQLRVQVHGALATARESVEKLRELEIPELSAMAEAHWEKHAGVSFSGWKNPYPISDPRSLLIEYQYVPFHDQSRFVFQLQARQTGKDFTMEGHAVTDCHTRVTNWMVAAPSERQSLDSLDQAKLWAQAYDMVIDNYVESRSDSQALLKSAEITWSSGSKMRAVPGKPDTVRGTSSNVLLTEFDFFEKPQATWRALLPSITNKLRGGEKRVRIGTTPNGKGGAADRIFNGKDGERMKWSRHLVTIYHAVLHGLDVDIAQLREAMNDADGWAQEMELGFLDPASVLLPYDLIDPCESDDCALELKVERLQGCVNPLYVGVDIGRKKDLTVIWVLEKLGDVLWTRGLKVFDRVPFREQFAYLLNLLARTPAIRRMAIDATGIGAQLGEDLQYVFGTWRVEACQFTTPFKEEIFLPLRTHFEDKTVRVPKAIEVREDLHGIQKITSASGVIRLTAPRNADGHCDRATALALGTYAAKSPGIIMPPQRVLVDQFGAAFGGGGSGGGWGDRLIG